MVSPWYDGEVCSRKNCTPSMIMAVQYEKESKEEYMCLFKVEDVDNDGPRKEMGCLYYHLVCSASHAITERGG